MKDAISKIGREQLNEMEKEINEIEGLKIDEEKLKAIRQGIALLRRAYDFCDTDIFVLTCVGMLKAGKSTLVSLMAGSKDASPTGFGVDTTLRPALIVPVSEKSGEPGIDIWRRDDIDDVGNDPSRQDLFERILFLEQSNCKRPKKQLKLETGNLSKALCNEYQGADDPILVVVRVPKNDESILVKSKVVILDTPGLDSARSNWTICKNGDEPVQADYDWILDATDMAVFVQSSVSALNSKATEVLRKLKEAQKETWLVHNEMKAKYWRAEESLKPAEESQKQAALDVFEGAGFNPKNIRPLSLNLGKAYDAMSGFSKSEDFKDGFSDVVQLKNESRIEEFECLINEFLQKNGECIRRKHCVGLVGKRVGNLNDALKDGIVSLNQVYETKRKAVENWCKGEVEVKKDYEEKFRIIVSIKKESEVSEKSTEKSRGPETDALFKDRFSLDKNDYGIADIREIVRSIKDDLPKVLEGMLSKELQHTRIVSERGDSYELNDYINSQFDVFRKIKTEQNECDWNCIVNDVLDKLLVTSTKEELLEDCRRRIPPVDIGQQDIAFSIAKAARGNGRRRWGWIGKKLFYGSEALSIADSCKEAFCEIEARWKSKVEDTIKEWCQNDFPRKLLCEFNKLLDAGVDQEVKKCEKDCNEAKEQIGRLTPLIDRMENMKIKE